MMDLTQQTRARATRRAGSHGDDGSYWYPRIGYRHFICPSRGCLHSRVGDHRDGCPHSRIEDSPHRTRASRCSCAV